MPKKIVAAIEFDIEGNIVDCRYILL